MSFTEVIEVPELENIIKQFIENYSGKIYVNVKNFNFIEYTEHELSIRKVSTREKVEMY